MGHPVKRRKSFGKSPTFSFATRKLRGVKEETAAERSQMEQAKIDWLAKNRPTKK